MRTVAALLIFATPLVAHADPPSLTAPIAPPSIEHTSYAAYTLTADGIGIGALIAGGIAEGPNGRDTTASDTLFTVGMLGSVFATPLIHGIRGHGMRALGSVLLRAGGMGIGMAVGISMASCSNGDAFCKLDGAGPGMIGGLIVASIVDAAANTDETVERPARWSPVIAPRSGGGTIGFAAAF